MAGGEEARQGLGCRTLAGVWDVVRDVHSAGYEDV
ncbi:hypothetical protein CUZ56_01721 [Saezia sanguinis]|uniref:Uncharacterized protein n=1 Tax=Saezia sanguinis TaxID=1965230 RepID=A0A433SCG8_9BURK|nr:hypothetical protein CUZ56_01721 [Saezia sanguinis]